MAAMKGDAKSRHNLGGVESGEGNHELAVQHFLISSSFGFKESVDAVKMMFKNGQASKDQFAKALKVYQKAIQEMKSPQREEANRLSVGFLKARKCNHQ